MLLVMFVGYLRPSEIVRKVKDVIHPASALIGPMQFACLKLHGFEDLQMSKTHEFDQSVSFDLPTIRWIGQALMRFTTGRGADEMLFSLSLTMLRTVFSAAVAKAGLKFLEPQLYMLRHGGISHDVALRVRDLPEIVKRARWTTSSQLRRYEKHVKLQEVLGKIPASLLCKASEVETHLKRLL
jgi:hypothetical protein